MDECKPLPTVPLRCGAELRPTMMTDDCARGRGHGEGRRWVGRGGEVG